MWFPFSSSRCIYPTVCVTIHVISCSEYTVFVTLLQAVISRTLKLPLTLAYVTEERRVDNVAVPAIARS